MRNPDQPRPKVLLIPGNELPEGFYEPFAQRLAQRGYDVDPLALPAPGRDLEQTLAPLMEAVSGAFTLVGHSLGGLIAAHVGTRVRLSGLVLLEPTIFPRPFFKLALTGYGRRVVNGRRDRFENRVGPVQRIAQPDQFPPAQLELYLKTRRTTSPADTWALLSILMESAPPTLSSVPLLWIRGARSGWSARLCARSVRPLEHARLVVIDDAGHFLFNEQDEALAREIGDFFDSLS